MLAVQCSGGMRVTPANRPQTAGATQGEIWPGNEGLRWQYRSVFLVGKLNGFMCFAIFQSPTLTACYHLSLTISLSLSMHGDACISISSCP